MGGGGGGRDWGRGDKVTIEIKAQETCQDTRVKIPLLILFSTLISYRHLATIINHCFTETLLCVNRYNINPYFWWHVCKCYYDTNHDVGSSFIFHFL